jgi:S-DNA-T family DNA segregation ATPase FtsK/SpoIIIE
VNKRWYYTYFERLKKTLVNKGYPLNKARRQVKKIPAEPEEQGVAHKRLKEVSFIFLIAVGLFIFIAFITYHRNDPGWSNTGNGGSIANMAGTVGAWIADVFLYLFGYISYLIPLAITYSGWLILRGTPGEQTITPIAMRWLRALGLLLTLTSGCGLFSLYLAQNPNYLPYSAGGIVGNYIGPGLVSILNPVGGSLILLAGFLAGITLFTGISWVKVLHSLAQGLLWCAHQINAYLIKKWQKWQLARQAARVVEPELIVRKKKMAALPEKDFSTAFNSSSEAPPPALKIVKPQKLIPQKSADNNVAKPERIAPTSFEGSELESLPALDLLEAAQHSNDKGFSEEVLEHLSRLVEEKLLEFGLKVNVVAVYPGPVITRFELALAPGIKVSKLTTLSKDIARSLSLTSVRIVEVIAGKSYVGLEIPNQHRQMVRLSEVLSSKEYADSHSPLSLGMGVDIAGRPVVIDVQKMPHLLVAGTTGSGKSVSLNAMLLSLLYKSTPDMVRLIMVDPKMLELSVYDGIPHLLTPVITDMKRAANALRWAIGEMERRYQLMSALGVRNLNGYNEKVNKAIKAGEPLLDPLWEPIDGQTPPKLVKLPYIVILIDEFADMMMVVGKKVDELIARLAQKARAAGIHLILATQRPSVDVITGLIKANIPARVAFQVSSRIDSRTILDQQGAEQLLGHGDMLYMEAGMGIPMRVHGAFVADDEVHNVVRDLKAKGKPAYLEEITDGGSDVGGPRGQVPGLDLGDNDDNSVDELFDQAVEIVAKTRRASISNVQRRLKIGYNRAARILEEMEVQGMVTTMESNGQRDVLLPPPQE